MPVTFETLKTNQQDYLLAYREAGELVMEPYCHCGNALEEDFHCNRCARSCDCTFIACRGPDALSVVEKLIHSNPNFRNYQAALLDA